MCLTGSSILLCVWHVRRAWMKNVLNKVNGKENKVSIFRALGLIMHSCLDDNSVKKAVARIFDEFKDQEKFLNYFKMTWPDNNKICKRCRFVSLLYYLSQIFYLLGCQ